MIDLTAAACTDAVLAKMAELLRSRPGPAPVKVRFRLCRGRAAARPGGVPVDSSAALMGELIGLLGTGAARVERAAEPSVRRRRARTSRALSCSPCSGDPRDRRDRRRPRDVHVGGSRARRGVRRRPARGRRAAVAAGAHVDPRRGHGSRVPRRSPERRDRGPIASLPVAVQAAGGVRTAEEVRALFEAGATRVVLGSAALADEHRATALLSAEGPRLVAGIEVDEGRIRSRGRVGRPRPDGDPRMGHRRRARSALLVTAVGAGGRAHRRRTWSSSAEWCAPAARCSRPAASRPSRDLHDLRAAGAAGAVVGRAALDGSLDLSAAIAEFALRPLERRLDSPPHGLPHRHRRRLRRDLARAPARRRRAAGSRVGPRCRRRGTSRPRSRAQRAARGRSRRSSARRRRRARSREDADPVAARTATRRAGPRPSRSSPSRGTSTGRSPTSRRSGRPCRLPVLRKDFLVHPSQVIEARAHGRRRGPADHVLPARDDELAALLGRRRDARAGGARGDPLRRGSRSGPRDRRAGDRGERAGPRDARGRRRGRARAARPVPDRPGRGPGERDPDAGGRRGRRRGRARLPSWWARR